MRTRKRSYGDTCRPYLDWIRSLPCLICERAGVQQSSQTNSHHYGPRAFGRKAPDWNAIPLCHVEHHQYGKFAVHQIGRKFAGHHGVDIEAEIQRLNEEYKALHERTR